MPLQYSFTILGIATEQARPLHHTALMIFESNLKTTGQILNIK